MMHTLCLINICTTDMGTVTASQLTNKIKDDGWNGAHQNRVESLALRPAAGLAGLAALREVQRHAAALGALRRFAGRE